MTVGWFKYDSEMYSFTRTTEPSEVGEPKVARDEKSSYYDAGGIEVLDVIKAKLTPEQYRGYLLGNAIKYVLRLNWKDTPERDAEKAANYLTWLKE